MSGQAVGRHAGLGPLVLGLLGFKWWALRGRVGWVVGWWGCDLLGPDGPIRARAPSEVFKFGIGFTNGRVEPAFSVNAAPPPSPSH